MFDETVAICFERGHYRENTWPSGVRQVLLPKVNDIDYIGRCKSFPDAYAKAKREIRGFKGSQVLYALSIDSCILACLLRRKGDLVVWEVGDLITPEVTQSWKKALIIRLEKSILKRSDYLVMTSHSMYDEYYAKLDPSSKKKLIVVENRLGEEFRASLGSTKVAASKPLRLTWSGHLRNEDLYRRVLEAVEADAGKRVVLNIWGGGPGKEMVEEFAARCPTIWYHGTYREDIDSIKEIHTKSDALIILERSESLNVKTALPNRFFHALAYETPIIATKGTETAARLKKLGVGMAIDELNEDWSSVFDRLADGQEVNKWLAILKTVPEKERLMDATSLVTAVTAWLKNR